MTFSDVDDYDEVEARLECLKIVANDAISGVTHFSVDQILKRAKKYADFVLGMEEDTKVEPGFVDEVETSWAAVWEDYFWGDDVGIDPSPEVWPAAFDMDFGAALNALKCGQKISRMGWNGTGMWLEFLVPDEMYIYMNNVQGDLVPWLASQTDLLAEDWYLV